ncbi:MAG TPA: GNAT family N-acetyltransferase, partial [Streptosporangiaceae bacterium]
MSTISVEPIPARRFTLVPLRADHAAEMTAVLADPQLYTFTGGKPPTTPELRARYERWTAGSPDAAVTWRNWVIQVSTPPSALVGTVQATISGTGGQRTAEVAWIVGTQWQGQGLATEAARALVGWLRRHSIDTVIAHIHPGHQASAAVAASAGLTPTDQWHDGERQWQLSLDLVPAGQPPGRRLHGRDEPGRRLPCVPGTDGLQGVNSRLVMRIPGAAETAVIIPEGKNPRPVRPVIVHPRGNEFQPGRPQGLHRAIGFPDHQLRITVHQVLFPGQVPELNPPVKRMLPARMRLGTQVAVKIEAVITEIRRRVPQQPRYVASTQQD